MHKRVVLFLCMQWHEVDTTLDAPKISCLMHHNNTSFCGPWYRHFEPATNHTYLYELVHWSTHCVRYLISLTVLQLVPWLCPQLEELHDFRGAAVAAVAKKIRVGTAESLISPESELARF